MGKANEAALANNLGPDDCHYLEMDAEHLDFDDRSFDLVFGSGILHHLDLEVALAEVSRVLTDGGSAVFFEPMGHDPAINLYRRLTPAMRTPDEHPLRVEDLRTAGRFFGTVVAEYHVLVSFAAIPFRRLRRYPAIVDRLNRVDTAALRRLPGLGRLPGLWCSTCPSRERSRTTTGLADSGRGVRGVHGSAESHSPHGQYRRGHR